MRKIFLILMALACFAGGILYLMDFKEELED